MPASWIELLERPVGRGRVGPTVEFGDPETDPQGLGLDRPASPPRGHPASRSRVPRPPGRSSVGTLPAAGSRSDRCGGQGPQGEQVLTVAADLAARPGDQRVGVRPGRQDLVQDAPQVHGIGQAEAAPPQPQPQHRLAQGGLQPARAPGSTGSPAAHRSSPASSCPATRSDQRPPPRRSARHCAPGWPTPPASARAAAAGPDCADSCGPGEGSRLLGSSTQVSPRVRA